MEQRSVTPRQGRDGGKEKRGHRKTRQNQQDHTEALSVAFPVHAEIVTLGGGREESRRQKEEGKGKEEETPAGVGRGRKANYIKTHGVRNMGPRGYEIIISGGRQLSREKSKERERGEDGS